MDKYESKVTTKKLSLIYKFILFFKFTVNCSFKALLIMVFSRVYIVGLFLFLSFLHLFSCKSDDSYRKIQNPFLNDTSAFIKTKQYERDITALIAFADTVGILSPARKADLAVAFANIADTSAIPLLFKLLAEPDSLVRIRSAYALGLLSDSTINHKLRQAFERELNSFVRAEILVSVGKTGTAEAEIFLSNLRIKEDQPVLLYGQMKALAKAAENGYSSYKLLPGLTALLKSENVADSTKYWISYYMYRAKMEISDFEQDFIDLFAQQNSFYVKENIIRLMQYTPNDTLRCFLLHIASMPQADYRLTVQALKSITPYPPDSMRTEIFSLLDSPNPHKALAAAEYLAQKAKPEWYSMLLRKAESNQHKRVSALLYGVALRQSLEKDSINRIIIEKYQTAATDYEKSLYIQALREYPGNYQFLKALIDSNHSPAIRSAAMTALSDIRLSENFDRYYKTLLKTENIDLKKEYAEICRKALLSNDPAVKSIAANLLYHPKFEARKLYNNTFFVKQALSSLNMPADIESFINLNKLNNYLNGIDEAVVYKKDYYFSFKQDSVKKLLPQPKIHIVSSKGIIELQLFVNKAPVSVYHFLQLVKNGYYNNKIVHRVVPGFVMQSGCARGDGWGSLPKLLRTEVAPGHYKEGSLGLASAGKDTESAQWFITTTHTPHLDGKYTLLGEVTAGMDVVHRIEAGDIIQNISLILE